MGRKLPDVIREKEFLELFKEMPSKKYKVACALGFYEGMRISEVVKLQPEHIDKESGFIKIVQGKGKKDAFIPIMPPLYSILRWGMKFIPIGVTDRQLRRVISEASQKILGKRIYFHTLRHSSATFWLNEKKVDIRHVQALLRHSRVSTTEIYTHINPSDLKKIFEEAYENE